MSLFIHWAIAHGIHYGPGKYLPMTLIARASEIEPMIYAWKTGIIWC